MCMDTHAHIHTHSFFSLSLFLKFFLLFLAKLNNKAQNKSSFETPRLVISWRKEEHYLLFRMPMVTKRDSYIHQLGFYSTLFINIWHMYMNTCNINYLRHKLNWTVTNLPPTEENCQKCCIYLCVFSPYHFFTSLCPKRYQLLWNLCLSLFPHVP